MDHFRKSLDRWRCVYVTAKSTSAEISNGASKSIMTWIQGVSEGLFRIWPRFTEKLGHAGIWKNSSCVELECGTTPAGRRRSSSSRREVFDGPLSGQSVYEQTSGVLRHTESVRGDKIQEQDWVSDIQVRTLRTLADARSNDPARSQASVSSRAHRKLPALPPTQRHHVLHSHRKSHERSACAPAPDSEESSFCPDGTVRTLFR